MITPNEIYGKLQMLYDLELRKIELRNEILEDYAELGYQMEGIAKSTGFECIDNGTNFNYGYEQLELYLQEVRSANLTRR